MSDRDRPERQDNPPAEAAAAAAADAAANNNDGPEPAAGERIAALEAEMARLKDQALRAMAEVENVRRRAEREREDAAKYGVSQLARDLLPVADNLRRAIEAVDDKAAQQDPALANLLTGVQATERELMLALERRGIRKIEPMGEKFDPNFHQAMFEVPTDEQPPGTVVQLLQPGYVIHDRLLRPALVGVAKPAADGAAERIDMRT
jgi:molecular chaperone GrpE